MYVPRGRIAVRKPSLSLALSLSRSLCRRVCMLFECTSRLGGGVCVVECWSRCVVCVVCLRCVLEVSRQDIVRWCAIVYDLHVRVPAGHMMPGLVSCDACVAESTACDWCVCLYVCVCVS